jgi:hypothetical protein
MGRSGQAVNMRIAFVIQTYRLFDQVARLIGALQQGCPDCIVVVTHNHLGENIENLTRRVRVTKVLPAIPGRGRFGLVDSYLSALRWLERSGQQYDWVVLLSGQDYPIRPLGQFVDELRRSAFDGYFYHFDPLDPQAARRGRMTWPAKEGENRYLFRYVVLKDELSVAHRALIRGPRLALDLTRNYRLNTSFGLSLGRRAQKTPFSADFRLVAGSYWHIIRRECSEALLEFVDENPDVVDYFRQVILPDECFLQTVLLNNGFSISADDLRYFDFRGSRHGHPKTLGPTDLDAAFASRCFFARKFDITLHPGILDRLDARAAADCI